MNRVAEAWVLLALVSPALLGCAAAGEPKEVAATDFDDAGSSPESEPDTDGPTPELEDPCAGPPLGRGCRCETDDECESGQVCVDAVVSEGVLGKVCGSPEPDGRDCPDGSVCPEGSFCENVDLGLACVVCRGDEDCDDPEFPNCYGGGLIHPWCGEPGNLGARCSGPSFECASGLFCFDFDPIKFHPRPVCTECATDDDCSDEQMCGRRLREPGEWGWGVYGACTAPGSAWLDHPCAIEHPDQCASGHCTEITEEPEFPGICGECESDSDCPGGACLPAGYEVSSVRGSEVSRLLGTRCGSL